MNSDRNAKKLGLLNFFVLLLVGIICALTAKQVSSEAGMVAVCFFGFGALVSAVACFQMRLESQERAEKLEYDELTKAKNAATLFDSTEIEGFPAQRARQQFERIFIPVFTFILFALQTTAVILLWRWLSTRDPFAGPQTFVGMALFGAFSLGLYFFGQYSANRARLENERLLRPSAGYLMLGSILTAIMACSEVLVWAHFEKLDIIIGRIICVIMGLAAVETLFGLVFEAYRPRVKGQIPRLLYESRVVELLGQPAGFASSAAQALDYQFGFKVSETWIYKDFKALIAGLLLLQFGLIWLCTCFVFIDPNEQGLVEFFGAPSRTLAPGGHCKLPWPFEKVYRFSTTQIQSFTVGVVPDPALEKEKTVLWTRPHYKEEFNMLVASRQQLSETNTNDQTVPVNMLTVSIPVQFVVSNVKDWAYNHADSSQVLEELATREVVHYLVSVDVDDFMSVGRITAAKALKERIQKAADTEKLGVNIVFVGLQDVHPPVGAAEAFEAVNGALQQRAATILAAEGDRSQMIPRAQADAAQKVLEANTYKLRKEQEAVAISGRFTNQVLAYKAAPTVYANRAYLATLARGIAPTRKLILGATNTQDVIILELQEKVREDLLGVTMPESQEKK